ncbi:MAG: RluA family pseudouridine synthase [Candidatus Sacchiramonaceae bacterium]|nr:RluA family pseudouridine synthase [Candidatus Saccharimonadaceae bacterium]
MAKFNSGDLLDILRRFKVAGEENVPRHIQEMKKLTPDTFSEIFSFKFNSAKYFIIVDGTAEDDENYITGLLNTTYGEIEGELIKNPRDDLLSFALPYQGKDIYLFKGETSKRRLDVLLHEKYPEFSRSTIQKYIKNGYATVNQKVILKSNATIDSKSDLVLEIPEKSANDDDFPIIYEDENVIVINKPAGILTHSKGVLNDEFTVADFFKKRGSTFASDTNRTGIVHRLDRDTSGVIVGAKNPEAAKKLQKQFSERTTKKTYFAVTTGTLKQQKAMIDLPIARNNSAPSTFKIDAKGKEAQTRYAVIAQNGDYSLVKLQPRTGRTHQLRVHMSYLGAPILGDRVYGEASKKADRMYLHAESLEVTIPPLQPGENSIRKIFTSPLPEEFNHFFDK